MARTGSFGRLPRAMPSLTNTLIAIAREQAQQEDQNIMDAWQKGGTVDGKKVTDKMVLDHWKGRLTDIAKDDPLYDTYKNLVTQYEYTIAESKMTAQYAMIADPKAGDDQRMVQFYLGWAKKLPKDSEMYRTLQRDAGQYIRAAKAKQKAKTDAEVEKAYRAQADAMEKKNELPGQKAIEVITRLAQQHNLLPDTILGDTSQVLGNTNLPDLQLGDRDPQSGMPGLDQMIALVQNLTPPPTSEDPRFGKAGSIKRPADPNEVLFTDYAGQPVTRQGLTDMFQKMDPNFDGQFTPKYILGLLKDQKDGLIAREKLARKTGHVSEAMSLHQQVEKATEIGNEVNAWPVAEAYNDLHQQKQAIMADNTLLPPAKSAALARVDAQIGDLAHDKRIANDIDMQTQLTDEANHVPGSPTLAEDLAGTRGPLTGKGDNATVGELIDTYAQQNDAVMAGTHVWTQGEYQPDPATGKTVFVPKVGGTSYGAATTDDINNLPGGKQATMVMVPNGDGGGATPMLITPQPIVAQARNADGSTMQPENQNPAGYFIQYPVNGKMTTLYSIERTDQYGKATTTWTSDPPWDKGKGEFHVENGVGILNITAARPGTEANGTGINLNQDHAVGNGWYVLGATTKADGTPVPGQLTYKPQEAVYMTDPTRQAAGHDPYTDSFSASLAALRTSPDGSKLLQQWTDDPRFKFILDNNAHMAAGQTLDPATNTWVGGDPNTYTTAMNSYNHEIGLAKSGQPLTMDPATVDQFDHSNKQQDMAGANALGNWALNITGGMPLSTGGFGVAWAPVPMPSDTAKAAGADNQMPALSNAANNDGRFPGKVHDDQYIPSIISPSTLTVPQNPYAPGPSPSPSPAPTASPTAPYTPPASPAPGSPPPGNTGYPAGGSAPGATTASPTGQNSYNYRNMRY